jgi:phosphate transport system permease protein
VSSGLTTTAAGGSPEHHPGDGPEVIKREARESTSSWSLVDRAGLAFAWLLGLTFCAIIVAIIVYVAVQGIRYLHPDLLWTNPKTADTEAKSGGFLDPIIGTFMTSGLALAIATPLGVGVAVWLSEYNRPKALARIVEMTVEMLAGAPSVVLALFGIVVFDSSFLGFLSQTNGGIVFGKSCFAAGLMLTFVALPLIVSTVREGLQQIPNHVREASYAVGKSKITTIRRILLPAARPSVVTGAMLGLGHSLGDTAIIVLLAGDTQVIQPAGGVPIIGDFRGTASTLTSYVFDNAPTGDLNHTQLAWAAAFVLMAIVLLLNLIVDVFSRRSREMRWS